MELTPANKATATPLLALFSSECVRRLLSNRWQNREEGWKLALEQLSAIKETDLSGAFLQKLLIVLEGSGVADKLAQVRIAAMSFFCAFVEKIGKSSNRMKNEHISRLEGIVACLVEL